MREWLLTNLWPVGQMFMCKKKTKEGEEKGRVHRNIEYGGPQVHLLISFMGPTFHLVKNPRYPLFNINRRTKQKFPGKENAFDLCSIRHIASVTFALIIK